MKNIYLKSVSLPNIDREMYCIYHQHEFSMTCYDNYYPFKILPEHAKELEFSTITILYGGNGSGKSTILNLIAQMLGINRRTRINKTVFWDYYVDLCEYEMTGNPEVKKIITSDDIFSNIFLTREKNEILQNEREEAINLRHRCNTPGVYIKDVMQELIGDGNWIENIDVLQKVVKARGMSASKFVTENVGRNLDEKSNGETALSHFATHVNEPGIYLLDEPENSMAAGYQRRLAQHLYESARFFGAQLVIATHSPFLLSIPEARIYNLDDEENAFCEDWTTLENMREYYALFKSYAKDFETGT